MGQSPKPKQKKPETMDFASAILRITEGQKVTRLEWDDTNVYGLLRNGQVQLHKADGNFYQWIISDGDLVGIDWVVVLPN